MNSEKNSETSFSSNMERPQLVPSPQKLSIMRPPVTSLPKRNALLPVHKATLLREIFNTHSLHLCSSLAEQCYYLYKEVRDNVSAGEDWVFSYSDVGLFFDISRQHVRKMAVGWRNMEMGKGMRLGGASKIS